jgi:predicted ATPase
VLEPTAGNALVFASETVEGAGKGYAIGAGSQETVVFSPQESPNVGVDYEACRVALSGFLSGFRVFHFHDTSNAAGMKRMAAVHDDAALRQDGSNLAAFLLKLKSRHSDEYEQIRKAIQLVIPFFDDFHLQPRALTSGEQQVNLIWKQRDSDYPFWPSQLSDGSIWFICLATALLQPDSPSTIIIDEPELGLHPYAITLLGSLLKSASKRMQVIVSTQSVPLVNQFSIDDLIIVEREEGASVFKRHNEIHYQQWLEDYSVGELWEKNILGGRPPK